MSTTLDLTRTCHQIRQRWRPRCQIAFRNVELLIFRAKPGCSVVGDDDLNYSRYLNTNVKLRGTLCYCDLILPRKAWNPKDCAPWTLEARKAPIEDVIRRGSSLSIAALGPRIRRIHKGDRDVFFDRYVRYSFSHLSGFGAILIASIKRTHEVLWKHRLKYSKAPPSYSEPGQHRGM